MTDKLRRTFHSSDFTHALEDSKINGKTQREWEDEFEVTNQIEHLKGLGWERYQWRWKHPDDCEENVKVGTMRFSRGCFAEFFSIHFHGYLRGDGSTVLEAVGNCVAKGQKIAKCEQSPGHDYVTPSGFKNGLMMCKHCGFCGHTSIFTNLITQVRNLRMELEVAKEMHLKDIESLRSNGKTQRELLGEELQSMAAAFAKQQEASDGEKENGEEANVPKACEGSTAESSEKENDATTGDRDSDN